MNLRSIEDDAGYLPQVRYAETPLTQRIVEAVNALRVEMDAEIESLRARLDALESRIAQQHKGETVQ